MQQRNANLQFYLHDTSFTSYTTDCLPNLNSNIEIYEITIKREFQFYSIGEHRLKSI